MSAIYNLSIIRGVTYSGFQIICKDRFGSIISLAGWSAFAEVRKDPDSSLELDLAPHIEPGDVDGLVTIPPISYTATFALAPGVYTWGIMLQTPEGYRLEPFCTGACIIETPIPQPAA